MKRILSLILSIIIMMSFSGTAYSGGKSKSNSQHNVSYQIMKIKHRAKKGFTNNGRVRYIYTTDEHVGELPPSEIGSVIIEKNSRLNEIYTAVDLSEHHNFSHNDDKPLKIGTVIDQSNRLNRVESFVKITHPIKY